MRFFGKYSYALYVVHLPLTTLIAKRFVSVAELPTIYDSQLVGLAIFAALVGSSSDAVAFVSWWAFESRFLRLKRFFPYDRRRGTPNSRS